MFISLYLCAGECENESKSVFFVLFLFGCLFAYLYVCFHLTVRLTSVDLMHFTDGMTSLIWWTTNEHLALSASARMRRFTSRLMSQMLPNMCGRCVSSRYETKSNCSKYLSCELPLLKGLKSLHQWANAFGSGLIDC